MIATNLFRSNTTLAVRLPRDVAFPPDVTRVVITRDGARRILTPEGALWDDFFDAPGIDLGARTQPAVQERPGL